MNKPVVDTINKEVELKVPAEVYSRIVGYFRPVDQWNRGKKEEFKERQVVEEKKTGGVKGFI